MLDMQETRQIGCKGQNKQTRVGERKWKNAKEWQRVTDWWGGSLLKEHLSFDILLKKGWRKWMGLVNSERKRSKRKLRWGMSKSLASKQVSQSERQLCTSRPLIFCQVRLGNCPQQWQLMGHPLHTRQLLYFCKDEWKRRPDLCLGWLGMTWRWERATLCVS